MHRIKGTLKNTLPEPVYSFLRESYDAARRLPDWPAAAFHPWRQDTIKRLKGLKDTHKGERCFLIGNGPSLRRTDLSRLKNEFTIGVNRFYLAFPELGFHTSYYLVLNDLVVEQSANEIRALEMPVFVSWRARQWIEPAPNRMFLYTTYTGRKFAPDVSGRVWEGGTVTYAGLQLAFHLGFKQVILIGVDHSYSAQGKPNETVVSQGEDVDHFHPGYFGKGVRWQLPDLASWEWSYQLAKSHYEEAGRQVLDATIGGKLQVFEKVDYDSLF
jgi:hypothetical protein